MCQLIQQYAVFAFNLYQLCIQGEKISDFLQTGSLLHMLLASLNSNNA